MMERWLYLPTSHNPTRITTTPPLTTHTPIPPILPHPINTTHLPYDTYLTFTPTHHHNTRFATWNLKKHASYVGSLHAYTLGTLDFFHCLEPSKRLSTPDNPLANRLIQTVHQTGYHFFITPHSHVYLKSDAICSPLLAHKSGHNRRIRMILFAGTHNTHTLVIALYTHQRGKLTTNTTPNTYPSKHIPTMQHTTINIILFNLKMNYPYVKTIVLGDIQHTINNTPQRQMGLSLSSPLGNLLFLLLQQHHHPYQSLISLSPHLTQSLKHR